MRLAAQELDVRLGSGPPVLRGLSAEFEPGTVTGVLGPNGAGKSTLLRALAGILKPSAGRVLLDGSPLGRLTASERADRLAYIPQREEIAGGFTVEEVVGFGVPPGDPRSVVPKAVDRLGLAPLVGRRVEALSEGQRQRVALARMMAQTLSNRTGGGGVILADEPAAALDPAFAMDALGLFRELARMGRTVVVVLHDLNLATRMADRALVLRGDGGAGGVAGGIAAVGPSAEVIRPALLEAVFGLPWTEARAESGPPIVIPRTPDPTIR